MTEKEIITIITSTEANELRSVLAQFHPFDLASVFPKLKSEQKEQIINLLNAEELAEIFSYLDEDDAETILSAGDSSRIAEIINEMEPDDAVDLLASLDNEQVTSIVNLLDEEVKQDLATLYQYEDDTAGSIMNTNYISIESGKDIKDLMRVLVREAPEVETINTSFVVNQEGRLLGTLDLKKVIIARSPVLVDDIMNKNFTAANVTDEIEAVIKKISDYDIYDMPVLENGILKGIITMDDALATISEESEEDYAKLAGLSDTEKIDESIHKSIRKRLPILAILLVLDIFVAIVISAYDYLFTIPALAVITIFQPIILALAGNTGTQSLGVTIQKIANGQLEKRNLIIKHILREFAIGILSSLVVGILVFLFTSGYLYLTGEKEIFFDIGLVVGLSVIAGLGVSNLFGSVTPILLDKINLDPAAISGPFLTTMLDIFAVLIYFALTTALVYNKIT